MNGKPIYSIGATKVYAFAGKYTVWWNGELKDIFYGKGARWAAINFADALHEANDE